jgi:protein-S-isoprenylcysteine O-methyltransferase Ste14
VTQGLSNGHAASRVFALAGGVVFVCSLLYGVWAYAVPFGAVVSGAIAVIGPALLDVALFTVFALHHSVFARSGVRTAIARRVSPRLERSVYVWIASLLFIAVIALWQPVGGQLWRVPAPWSLVLVTVQVVGVLITLRASGALDVFSLAGVRQAFGHVAPAPAPLIQTGLYRIVRHPIYFGWVLMVWPTPVMTGTRLVFAAVSTLYLAIAIPFEERSLRAQFSEYPAYSARVRWRMLPGLY